MPIPHDYRARVYAGVLGKIIGVYLGRPFEGWTHQRIMAELGPITGYMHETFGVPLVVTDDDIAGTFTFLRALEEHGVRPDLSAEEIGRTWLNNIVENRSNLWWGGNGNSTEHTAWLNLKRGVPAPASGSIAINGATVAEQIGAQIFIDGWAMVSPGNPRLAARLAEQASRVSHDGEAVHAAMLLAAMEAEAFVSNDMDHLIDVGLSVIPPGCLIARLIGDVRGWHAQNPDWRETRRMIEVRYGYDSYPGLCHVAPNHALIIMSLLYAPDDFHLAQTIVNTSGWDTDCNAGNVGCLLGIKLGLAGLEGGPDWRGPVADRILISSANGGDAITDAVRVSTAIVDLGVRLAGSIAFEAPKDGAPFHFSLPGSVQGFKAEVVDVGPGVLSLCNDGGRLALRFTGLASGQRVGAMTPTFAPPESPQMRSYELMACPLIYAGQRIEARIAAPGGNVAPVHVALRIKVYGRDDALQTIDGPGETIVTGDDTTLRWTLPDTGGQPIQQVGLAVCSDSGGDGVVHLDWLRWSGAPDLRLRKPDEPCDFWRQAWVNDVTFLSRAFPEAFRISQNVGEGLIITGTRDWRDYEVSSEVTIHLAEEGGIAARVQGLRRFYALVLSRNGQARLIKVRDDARTVMAEQAFAWSFESPYPLKMIVRGSLIACFLGPEPFFAVRDETDVFEHGGIALIVNQGALSTSEIRVNAPDVSR